MKIEQLYTKCLAQGAYYIESEGEVAIIDPLREVDTYIRQAAESQSQIKYIFETHFHADFVSGHVTLSEKTDAPIIYGPNANPSFKAHIAKDGEEFKLGKLTIKVLHTPGHTLESSTYLLKDETGKDIAIFTGDTLFLGDVGRPDLAQKSGSITKEDLAGFLFDSLRNKILPLSDDIIVYPAHGAGSACGKNMMKETVDTLGNQKKVNYALRSDMSKDDFIKEVCDGLLPPPSYFPLNVQLNKEGYKSTDEVFEKGKIALSPKEFSRLSDNQDSVILDVRSAEDFSNEHVPNSIFVGLDGSFAPWVGELLGDIQTPLLLVCPEGREEETITRLARVGFDNILGFLNGGIQNWKMEDRKVASQKSIPASELASQYEKVKNNIVDVRKNSEFLSQHILKTSNSPLSTIAENIESLDVKEPIYLHCAGGYRSMIAASILKSKGIHNAVNVLGGFSAIKETSIPLSDYVCPSEL